MCPKYMNIIYMNNHTYQITYSSVSPVIFMFTDGFCFHLLIAMIYVIIMFFSSPPTWLLLFILRVTNLIDFQPFICTSFFISKDFLVICLTSISCYVVPIHIFLMLSPSYLVSQLFMLLHYQKILPSL